MKKWNLKKILKKIQKKQKKINALTTRIAEVHVHVQDEKKGYIHVCESRNFCGIGAQNF
ncbi:hypothetical protein VNN41_09895 [Lactococcus garvieae]|uniref:hypothetical protein n=1 Tax=Lactococcus garvieae TaxID=1363 RepID=UPI0032501742